MTDVTSTDAGDAAEQFDTPATGTGVHPNRPVSVGPADTTTRDPWTVSGVVIAAVLIAACVAAGLAAIVTPRPVISGLPASSVINEMLLPAVKAIFDLSAALTIGWLLAAAWLVPPQRSGLLEVGGYRAIKAASIAATVWSASAFSLIPLILWDISGGPIGDALAADRMLAGLSLFDNVKAALIAGIVAALIAILARIVLTPGWAAVLLVAALAALLPQANSGHAAGSTDHDVAIDTMVFHLIGVTLWVGGLVAFLGLARQHVKHLPVIAHRYSMIAFWAFIAVALSGFGNAWVRISYLSDLWTTDYGRLVLLKAGLLTCLGVVGYVHRKRTLPLITDDGDRRPLIRLAVVEVGIMAATIGVASALARTVTPPPSGVAPSDTELILGYDIAAPPTFLRLLTDWRFDWLLGVAVIVAAVLYLLAVRRLHRRGDSWPAGRTVAWMIGCALVVFATSSGLGRYAEAQFSIHMMAHMLLGMIAPIMLVLGGPMTLALRALPAAGRGDVPGLRELITTGLHSRPARFITHPLVVFPLFILSFYALYFTSLFEVMIASHLGHLVMNLHFLVVGYLYYWVIIGVDPSPRQVQPMVKLAMLLGALPFHAFFGLALMNSHKAMATDYYNSLALPWVTDVVGDQRLGGAIAWGATEIPMIIVMIALVSQWARGDERDARRSDRIGDRKNDEELDAYNRMLAVLAGRDQPMAPAQVVDLTDEPTGERDGPVR